MLVLKDITIGLDKLHSQVNEGIGVMGRGIRSYGLYRYHCFRNKMIV